jgi:hypothetical protein
MAQSEITSEQIYQHVSQIVDEEFAAIGGPNFVIPLFWPASIRESKGALKLCRSKSPKRPPILISFEVSIDTLKSRVKTFWETNGPEFDIGTADKGENTAEYFRCINRILAPMFGLYDGDKLVIPGRLKSLLADAVTAGDRGYITFTSSDDSGPDGEPVITVTFDIDAMLPELPQAAHPSPNDLMLVTDEILGSTDLTRLREVQSDLEAMVRQAAIERVALHNLISTVNRRIAELEA